MLHLDDLCQIHTARSDATWRDKTCCVESGSVNGSLCMKVGGEGISSCWSQYFFVLVEIVVSETKGTILWNFVLHAGLWKNLPRHVDRRKCHQLSSTDDRRQFITVASYTMAVRQRVTPVRLRQLRLANPVVAIFLRKLRHCDK